jgi:hypothetical protein
VYGRHPRGTPSLSSPKTRKDIGVAAKEKPKYVFRRLRATVSPTKNVSAIAMAVSPHLPLEKFLSPRQGKHHRCASEVIATTTTIIPHIQFFTAKLSFLYHPIDAHGKLVTKSPSITLAPLCIPLHALDSTQLRLPHPRIADLILNSSPPPSSFCPT